MSRVPATRDSDLNVPFVLDESAVKKLTAAMERFSSNDAVFSVECADGLTRELDSKALLAYENSSHKAITSIWVRTRHKEDLQRSAAFRLRDSAYIGTINVQFSGPESEVEKLNDTVEELLSGMRPWYWWLARYSLLVLSLAFCGLSSLVGNSVVFFWFWTGRLGFLGPANEKAETGHNVMGAIHVTCVVIAAISLSFAAMFVLDRVKNKVFPRATFAIGQGARRYRVMDKVRWTVVIGFVVSFVAGVIVLCLQK